MRMFMVVPFMVKRDRKPTICIQGKYVQMDSDQIKLSVKVYELIL